MGEKAAGGWGGEWASWSTCEVASAASGIGWTSEPDSIPCVAGGVDRVGTAGAQALVEASHGVLLLEATQYSSAPLQCCAEAVHPTHLAKLSYPQETTLVDARAGSKRGGATENPVRSSSLLERRWPRRWGAELTPAVERRS